MLAGDIKSILATLVDDYSSLGISDFIGTAANIIENRSNLRPKEYNDFYKQIQDQAEKIQNNNKFKDLPDRLKAFIENGPYTVLIPEKIARYVRMSVDPNIENLKPSAEIRGFIQLASNRIKELQTAYATLSNLGIPEYKVPDNYVAISIEFPRSNFENDIGDLGDKLRKFDKVFTAISEVCGNASEKPRLLSASTTDFLAILIAHADEAAAVLKFMAAFTEVVIKQIDMYSAVKKMRNIGLDEKVVEPAEKAIDKASEQLVADTISKLIEEIKSKDSEIRPEARITIQNNSTFVIRNIADGVKINIEHNTSKQIEVLSSSRILENRVNTLSLIEMQRDNQALIERSKLEHGTPLLQYKTEEMGSEERKINS